MQNNFLNRNELSAEFLKKIFLERYAGDELYPHLIKIYELYEKELRNKTQRYYKKVLELLEEKQNQEIKEFFLSNFTSILCDYLSFLFTSLHYELEFKRKVENLEGEVELIVYNRDKETLEINERLVILQELAVSSGKEFFPIYIDSYNIKNLINSWFIHPQILIKLFSSKKKLTFKKYQEKLIAEQEKSQRVSKFLGKKLKKEKKEMFVEINNIRKEKIKKFGYTQRSSMLQCTRDYSNMKELHWNERKIKSQAQLLSYHLMKKNLE